MRLEFMPMTFQEVLDHFGSQANIARAMNTSLGVVWAWKDKDRIPLGRQFQIQVLTGGKLRADPAHAVTPSGRVA